MRNNMIEQNRNTLPKDDLMEDGKLYVLKGNELQAILQRYGLSYEQFGKLVGKSRYTIGRWVSGDCSEIKMKYAQKLETIVGKSIYRMVILECRQKRRKQEEEYKRYQEERAIRKNLKS